MSQLAMSAQPSATGEGDVRLGHLYPTPDDDRTVSGSFASVSRQWKHLAHPRQQLHPVTQYDNSTMVCC